MNTLIKTENLILSTMDLKTVRYFMENNFDTTSFLGWQCSPYWPTIDIMTELFSMEKLLCTNPSHDIYGIWMVILRHNRLIIGDVGFRATPDINGTLTIDYGIVPDQRNKGYGFEAVSTIFSFMLQNPAVSVVKAKCHCENIFSLKILYKIGMTVESQTGKIISLSYVKNFIPRAC
ncbi:MAG TPA: GNAT family N-acetyltransferase [Petrotogaceae bacterium]|nr:GNAT family N-acetyltransferase [Petrotogaceae bacterium]